MGKGFVFPFIFTIFAIVYSTYFSKQVAYLFHPSTLRNAEGFSIFAPTNLMNMEQVNHPQHYTTYDVETLDMMIRIWGIQETISFCKLNAFKYRMRAGHKDNAQQDIDKALWYENKMKELSSCNNE